MKIHMILMGVAFASLAVYRAYLGDSAAAMIDVIGVAWCIIFSRDPMKGVALDEWEKENMKGD